MYASGQYRNRWNGTVDKEDILITMCECMIVNNTRTHEMAWSRMAELRIKCGSSRRGHIRGWVRWVYNQWGTGVINIYVLYLLGNYGFAWNAMMLVLNNINNNVNNNINNNNINNNINNNNNSIYAACWMHLVAEKLLQKLLLFSLQLPLFCHCVPGVVFPGLKNKSIFPNNYHTVQRLGFFFF